MFEFLVDGKPSATQNFKICYFAKCSTPLDSTDQAGMVPNFNSSMLRVLLSNFKVSTFKGYVNSCKSSNFQNVLFFFGDSNVCELEFFPPWWGHSLQEGGRTLYPVRQGWEVSVVDFLPIDPVTVLSSSDSGHMQFEQVWNFWKDGILHFSWEGDICEDQVLILCSESIRW